MPLNPSSSTGKTQERPAHDAKTVVIVMTSGPSQPERCATPFYLGALLASMDAQVTIFFTMDAVRLVRHGVAQSLTAVEDGKRIIDFMRDAKQMGVRFHACRPALPGFAIERADLIPEVDEVSSGGALADMILNCDKVLFF